MGEFNGITGMEIGPIELSVANNVDFVDIGVTGQSFPVAAAYEGSFVLQVRSGQLSYGTPFVGYDGAGNPQAEMKQREFGVWFYYRPNVAFTNQQIALVQTTPSLNNLFKLDQVSSGLIRAFTLGNAATINGPIFDDPTEWHQIGLVIDNDDGSQGDYSLYVDGVQYGPVRRATDTEDAGRLMIGYAAGFSNNPSQFDDFMFLYDQPDLIAPPRYHVIAPLLPVGDVRQTGWAQVPSAAGYYANVNENPNDGVATRITSNEEGEILFSFSDPGIQTPVFGVQAFQVVRSIAGACRLSLLLERGGTPYGFPASGTTFADWAILGYPMQVDPIEGGLWTPGKINSTYFGNEILLPPTVLQEVTQYGYHVAIPARPGDEPIAGGPASRPTAAWAAQNIANRPGPGAFGNP